MKVEYGNEGQRVLTLSDIRQEISADNTEWGYVQKKCLFGGMPGYGSGIYAGIRMGNEPEQEAMSTSTEHDLIVVHYAFTPDFKKIKITFEAMNDVWLQNGNKMISYVFIDGKPALGETGLSDYWKRFVSRKCDEEVKNHFSQVFSGTRKFFTGLESVGIEIPGLITD